MQTIRSMDGLTVALPSTAPLASRHLASYHHGDYESPSAALVTGSVLTDLPTALAAHLGAQWADNVPGAAAWLSAPERLELFLAIRGWEPLLKSVGDALNRLATDSGVFSCPVGEASLRSPVRWPEKIICVGLNYASHADEALRTLPKYPVLFAKFANALVGPTADVKIPQASHRIDYEGELAVIMGQLAKHVSRDDADRYVAGYAVANDVSARDYQFRTKEMLQGKAFDDFCPLGPWITKPRSVHELGSLRLTTEVSGDVRQSAALEDMIFDVPFLVEYLSAFMTLRPGDVILTGTPAGVGGARKPPRWLRDTDTVTVEISEVGTLCNKFVGGRDQDRHGSVEAQAEVSSS